MDTLTDFTDYVPTPEQMERAVPIVLAALNELGYHAWSGPSSWIPDHTAIFCPGVDDAVRLRAINLGRMAVGLPTFTDKAEHRAYELWSLGGGGDA